MARIRADGSVEVAVDAGPVLDEVVLRSYCIGATHQALGWVRSEGVAVDAEGTVRDLTIRSFGILQARAMPPVTVTHLPTRRRHSRSTGPTRCSPRWPLPGGWPTASRPSGPPTGPAPVGDDADRPGRSALTPSTGARTPTRSAP